MDALWSDRYLLIQTLKGMLSQYQENGDRVGSKSDFGSRSRDKSLLCSYALVNFENLTHAKNFYSCGVHIVTWFL